MGWPRAIVELSKAAPLAWEPGEQSIAVRRRSRAPRRQALTTMRSGCSEGPPLVAPAVGDGAPHPRIATNAAPMPQVRLASFPGATAPPLVGRTPSNTVRSATSHENGVTLA